MTTPHSGTARPVPLQQQVARSLRNQIEAGVLRDGEVLPSTRTLAAQWNVSKDRSRRTVTAPAQVVGAAVRLKAPKVVLVGGFAGSGKTELGRILARETGWAILDKDTISRSMSEEVLTTLGYSPHDRESRTYLSRVRPLEYEALAAVVQENIECGNSVIATAPFIREFTDPTWVARMCAAHESIGASTALIWISCDGPTMHRYVRQRGAARDSAKLADWNSYLSSIDLTTRPIRRHTVIDNSTSSPPLQVQARSFIASLLGGQP
jgi:predicted kinase